MPDSQLISPLPKFGFQIGVLGWRCRAAFGDAKVVVGAPVLADVLKTGAVNTVVVGG
jgi:hypothetical protein